jgi:hypothetical protein
MTPAEIARGLTKAQRTALWNLGLERGWQLPPHDGWRRAGLACCGLFDKGLANRTVEKRVSLYRLTPLGLEVRAIIEQEARDERG